MHEVVVILGILTKAYPVIPGVTGAHHDSSCGGAPQKARYWGSPASSLQGISVIGHTGFPTRGVFDDGGMKPWRFFDIPLQVGEYGEDQSAHGELREWGTGMMGGER